MRYLLLIITNLVAVTATAQQEPLQRALLMYPYMDMVPVTAKPGMQCHVQITAFEKSTKSECITDCYYSWDNMGRLSYFYFAPLADTLHFEYYDSTIVKTAISPLTGFTVTTTFKMEGERIAANKSEHVYKDILNSYEATYSYPLYDTLGQGINMESTQLGVVNFFFYDSPFEDDEASFYHLLPKGEPSKAIFLQWRDGEILMYQPGIRPCYELKGDMYYTFKQNDDLHWSLYADPVAKPIGKAIVSYTSK